MDTTQAKNGISKVANKTKKAAEQVETQVDHAEMALRERVDEARDLVEDLRDRAELAFHERPYLLPVATGALGLGIGVLIGSKLSRLIVLTAAGALLSDTVRTQVARVSKDLIRNLSDQLKEGDEGEELEEQGEDVEALDDTAEPSVT